MYGTVPSARASRATHCSLGAEAEFCPFGPGAELEDDHVSNSTPGCLFPEASLLALQTASFPRVLTWPSPCRCPWGPEWTRATQPHFNATASGKAQHPKPATAYAGGGTQPLAAPMLSCSMASSSWALATGQVCPGSALRQTELLCSPLHRVILSQVGLVFLHVLSASPTTLPRCQPMASAWALSTPCPPGDMQKVGLFST